MGNFLRRYLIWKKELDAERKELEKRKKVDFQAKSTKDDFSYERKTFQQEIHKLTRNMATLSTDIMKEQKVKSDLQKKLEFVTKERNAFSFKVKALNKSESYSESPIRPSNIFYDHSVDNPNAYRSQSVDFPTFKRVNMVWRAKCSTPEEDATISSVSKGKSFIKPDYVYSANHLIRLAEKNICCSYCGTHDFVKNENVQFWYGSYNISSNRTPLNKSRPKFRWVPNLLNLFFQVHRGQVLNSLEMSIGPFNTEHHASFQG